MTNSPLATNSVTNEPAAMSEMEMAIYKQFLDSLGVSLGSETPAQASDAKAYVSCYFWYLSTQNVLPQNAEIASKVWVQKYALHDDKGMCLEKTPEDMWHRMADTLAEVEVATNKSSSFTKEEWSATFFDAFKDFKAVPGGSALNVLGNNYINSSVSNCFVVGTEDSIEGIMKTAAEMARIQSYRGGTGIDLSTLRPADAYVSNSAKKSTGAASFMDFFSKVTSTIGQAGRCLEESQPVLTARGAVAIKNVVPGDLVWTTKGWIRNVRTICNGVKPVNRLTTSRGYSILATSDHLFTASVGKAVVEKPMHEFVVGDSICLLPGTPVQSKYVSLDKVEYTPGHDALNGGNRLREDVVLPELLTEELAYYLGYSYGDGYCEYDRFGDPKCLQVACAHAYPAIQEKLQSSLESVFSYRGAVRPGDGAVNQLSVHRKLICKFLEHNGLLKQKHDRLVFPEKIAQSPASVQAAFIAGYFDADGYASGAKRGYVISSVCRPMLQAIQNVLLQLGVWSTIHAETAKKSSHKDLYSLCVVGSGAQHRFVNLMQESVKVASSRFVSSLDRCLTPVNAQALGVAFTTKSRRVPTNSQYISARLFEQLRDLGEITDNLLIMDYVTSIESIGDAVTYDLQLESHHLFYCAGFNVHNSGATMITLDVTHPDVERFIEEKQDLDKKWFFEELRACGIDINDWKYTPISARLKSTTKANVSVKATDDFMKAVENDAEYTQQFIFTNGKYPSIQKQVPARQVWNKLVAANVASAEPGILFWDTILRESVSDCYGGRKSYSLNLDGEQVTVEHDITTVCTNPCSELPLPVGSACTLLSQNLTRYVLNPWQANAKFDFDRFISDIRISTRILDNIKEYDISRLPLQVNKIDAILCRRIGLGCHGLADTLAALGLVYDTQDAVDMVESIYRTLANTVYDESANLSIEKGAFPIWDWALEKDNPFLNRLDVDVRNKIKQHGRRNIACLTNAPTGSLSIISRNCSSGIEPVFKLRYLRNIKKQGSEETVQYEVLHQAFRDCLDAGGSENVFRCANDISWEFRVKLQAAAQKYIDHSISSTINLPEGTTEETVSNIYMAAWKAGLKGITVYVDNCRTGVLVSADKKKSISQTSMERPKTTAVDIFKTKYKEKPWMILVGKVDGKPIEIFGGLEDDGLSLPTKYHRAELTKKSRGHYSLTVWLSSEDDDILRVNNIGNRFPAQDIVTLTRMISLSLRNGISVADIVEQLQKAATSLYDGPAVFARVLKNYLSDEEIISKETSKGKVCPECGAALEYKREAGCLVELCTSCAYTNSKCN